MSASGFGLSNIECLLHMTTRKGRYLRSNYSIHLFVTVYSTSSSLLGVLFCEWLDIARNAVIDVRAGWYLSFAFYPISKTMLYQTMGVARIFIKGASELKSSFTNFMQDDNYKHMCPFHMKR